MVSKHHGESWCQNHLADQELFQLQEKVDTDLTEETRLKGCPLCGGKLHRSDCGRKPRGGPRWDVRFSLCCDREPIPVQQLQKLCGMRTAKVCSALAEPTAQGQVIRDASGYQLKLP